MSEIIIKRGRGRPKGSLNKKSAYLGANLNFTGVPLSELNRIFKETAIIPVDSRLLSVIHGAETALETPLLTEPKVDYAIQTFPKDADKVN